MLLLLLGCISQQLTSLLHQDWWQQQQRYNHREKQYIKQQWGWSRRCREMQVLLLVQ
jgi:hypothetical protein